MSGSNLAYKWPVPEIRGDDAPARKKRVKKVAQMIYEPEACEACGDTTLVRYDIHTHCETCGSSKGHK